MPNNSVAMNPYVPPVASELCETFFFGASPLLDALPVSPGQEIPGVYSALFAFSIFFML